MADPRAAGVARQVWKDGKKAEELVGADKTKLEALVTKYAA